MEREVQQGQQDEDGGSSQIHQIHKTLEPQQLPVQETQTEAVSAETPASLCCSLLTGFLLQILND